MEIDMQLVSYRFLLFLFILVLLYYILPKKFRWMLMLSAGLLFYASSGSGGLICLFVTVLSTWGMALYLGCKKKGEKGRKAVFILGLILNAGILCVLKYTNFFLETLNSFLEPRGYSYPYVNWLLPLGISYYTFQSIGYFIDVYQKKIEPEKNFFRYALFVTFFPQMVQGPISRYDELKEQLFTPCSFDFSRIKSGLLRMLWGYFKKLVVADRIAPLAIAISQAPEGFDGIFVWIGMFAYTIWMYSDFTGGIDIVLGAAELFGIALPENFDHPFFSKNLAEFWRRWHMSLMRWLREYIFFPISMSKAAGNLSKKARKLFGKDIGKIIGRRVPLYMASIITWLVTGIWHGASWNFICWGMANCIALLISQELSSWSKNFRKLHSWTETKAFNGFLVIRTFLIFCILEMFEYYPFSKVFQLFGSMFIKFDPGQLMNGALFEMGLTVSDLAILTFSVALMVWTGFVSLRTPMRVWLSKRPGWLRFILVYALFLLVLIFGVYGQGYDASRFIYNMY